MKYTRTGYINNLYGFLFHLKGGPRPSPQDFRVYKEDRWDGQRKDPIASINQKRQALHPHGPIGGSFTLSRTNGH